MRGRRPGRGDARRADELGPGGRRLAHEACDAGRSKPHGPGLARIVLLEAPSVLGWQEWREIDERYGLGLVSAGLRGAMDAGALRRQPVKPLAHLMLGALGEAAMLIANADDSSRVRREVEPPLVALLDGLRT